MESFSSWSWLIVLAAIFWVGYPVFASTRDVVIAHGGGGRPSTAPKGLRGWLAVLLFGQVFSIVVALWLIWMSPVESHGNDKLKLAVNWEAFIMGAFLLLVIFVALAMVRKLRSFPRLWIYQGSPRFVCLGFRYW